MPPGGEGAVYSGALDLFVAQLEAMYLIHVTLEHIFLAILGLSAAVVAMEFWRWRREPRPVRIPRPDPIRWRL